MADINEKRAYVAAMYENPKWKTKVRHMSDIQVTAIYLKKTRAALKEAQVKKEKDDNDEIPF